MQKFILQIVMFLTLLFFGKETCSKYFSDTNFSYKKIEKKVSPAQEA